MTGLLTGTRKREVRIDDYPGIHRPRTKFLDVQKANLRHRKQRKHSRSQTSKITRRLIDLLGKILKEIREIERTMRMRKNC